MNNPFMNVPNYGNINNMQMFPQNVNNNMKPGIIPKINDSLRKELEEEKEKNKILQNTINQLNNTISQLKQKNNIDNEKYKGEIKTYIDKIEILNNQVQKLSLENNNLKKEIKKFNPQNNSGEIFSLYKRIDNLNKKIEELNEKLDRYPFILEKDEKILSIIFATSSFSYSIVCKNTDTISKLENELYQIFPDLAETNNYFLCQGTVANKYKKLEELKLKNGDIIVINHNED